MKNSDPSHPKSLYTVYYPPHVLLKMMGSISLVNPPPNFAYKCMKCVPQVDRQCSSR